MRRKSALWILASLLRFSAGAWVAPLFLRARSTPALNLCVNNLRVLTGAKEMWAAETRRATNDIPTWDAVRPYLKGGSIPACPEGGAYTLRRVGEVPTCSRGGLEHSLDFDNAKGRSWSGVAGSLALVSAIGLFVALIPPTRARARGGGLT